jgi:hypothetical protein
MPGDVMSDLFLSGWTLVLETLRLNGSKNGAANSGLGRWRSSFFSHTMTLDMVPCLIV